MPYNPISRPRPVDAGAEDPVKGGASTRTVAGSASRARLRARTFIRNREQDAAPPWGMDHSFSEQRMMNPQAFDEWGQKLLTTRVGEDFIAQPTEPQPFDEAGTTEELL